MRSERKFLFVEWTKFGVAAVLVACITPYGPESILVTFRIFNLGDALGMISEWQSPNFGSMPLQEVILLIALYVGLSRGLKLPFVRLLIVLGLLHLFLKHVRNAELLAMLAPLIVAPVLARQWPTLRPTAEPPAGSLLRQRLAALGRPAGRNAIALCLVLGAVYAAGVIRFAGIRPPENTMPVAAFDFIREANLQGNVLNHYGFGGYLINSGIKTFIDGRGELYRRRLHQALRRDRQRQRGASARGDARRVPHRLDASPEGSWQPTRSSAICPTGSASTATTPPPSSSASASHPTLRSSFG